MVFDVNPDAIGGRVSVQSHFGVVMRELEGVLQKISDRGHHDFPVDIQGKPAVDIANRKLALSSLRL